MDGFVEKTPGDTTERRKQKAKSGLTGRGRGSVNLHLKYETREAL
jgi:hypothetical protein